MALQEEKASLHKLIGNYPAQVNDLTEKLEAAQVGGDINDSIEYRCAFMANGMTGGSFDPLVVDITQDTYIYFSV